LRRTRRIDFNDIPAKANLILHCILVAMILVLLRVWHLAVIEIDQKQEESRHPQRKTVIEPAIRATIRDRFNLPLAINRVHYQAAILYSQIKDIPSFIWEKNEKGEKVKVYKRKAYIRNLAQLLAGELKLDAERIEDLIHAKASYYSQVPFVIKEEISEEEFYRLKMLGKDWPGIHMRRLPRRFYPRGRTAADIIGYMGAINRQEYEKILHEIKALEILIKDFEEGQEIEWPGEISNMAQAWKRLKDLQGKAYSIHDYIGKTGIEGIYEEQLRGYYGKKSFYSNSRGNFLQELPGTRPPLSGHRILLTISAELQEYAEQLLAQNEEVRLVRKCGLGAIKNTVIAEKHPWIKGGSITVMHPFTGELLALATFPRYDLNDFILSGDAPQLKKKKNRINRWLENDQYLANIWNLQQFFEREQFDSLTQTFFDETRLMEWSFYLDLILPSKNPLRLTLDQFNTVGDAIRLQEMIKELQILFPDWSLYTLFNFLYPEDTQFKPILKPAERQKMLSLFHLHQQEATEIKKKMEPYFIHLTHNYDKVLLADLYRLSISSELFTSELAEAVGQDTLDMHRKLTGSWISLSAQAKEQAKKLFHQLDFKAWRESEEKEFLRIKRQEEKAAKAYPKPYIDYLDQEENRQFQQFWEANRWSLLLAFFAKDLNFPSEDSTLKPYYDFFRNTFQEKMPLEENSLLQKRLDVLPPHLLTAYFKTMRSYEELDRPLLGSYRYLRSPKKLLEKHLAAAFYPMYGYGFARSQGYRQATTQGSLFKLVTSYAALTQRYKNLKGEVITFHDLNPLTIVDDVYQMGNTRYVGYTAEGKPIPQLYKGGRLPRSLAHQHIGKVDLIRALEVSSNPYFSLLAGECLENPDDLADAARLFSYGSKTGIELPGEIPGKVPADLASNRTGLYAMAIGQHSLVVTPLQTAVMLSAIANGGKILKPKIVHLTAGREPSRGEAQILCPQKFPYQDSLALIGLDFPLLTAFSGESQESLVKAIPSEVKNEIFMPEMVRQVLLKGLRASLLNTYQASLSSLTKLYRQHPNTIKDFTEMKESLLGKTSTSESVENIDLDLEEGTSMYTHVWFGSIAFQQGKKDSNKNIFILKDEFGQPELVVVVYLKYGGYGKEAAPLAAQIVKKWLELKQKYDQ
jgi:cell division protein FtsI/penicillin-binding protein 2